MSADGKKTLELRMPDHPGTSQSSGMRTLELRMPDHPGTSQGAQFDAVTEYAQQPSMGDELSAELDRFMSVTSIYSGSMFETISDVHLGAYMHHQSQQRSANIYYGVVKHAMPYFNTYRVSVAGLNGEIACSRMMSDSSSGVLGATDGGMISVGDTVMLHYRPDTFHGVIMGVIPTRCTDGNTLYSDYVVQGGGVGMHKDAVHQSYVTSTGDEGGAIDFNCHRPMDQLTTDWNRGFATGTLVHVDPFMALLRSSEMCGVFCLPGEHFRAAGLTMEVWSEGHTLEAGNDDGETYTRYQEFLYPHEALGAFQAGVTTSRDVDATKVVYDEPHGPLEAAQASQQPFARYEEYGGYTGRGRIRQMQAPPPGASSELYAYSRSPNPITVIREHMGANGEYSLQAAKSIVLSKRTVMPSIVQARLRDDQQEDSDQPTNYKFSGLHGSGRAHLAPEVKLLGEEPGLLAVTALADLHTYKVNWKALCALRYHEGDYNVREESESTGAGVNHVMPTYSQLKSKMWLERPSPTKLYVDHVERQADIYALMSHIAMLDDGGLTIQAGDGSELRLGGGNAVLDAPNLVLVQSGGSFVVLAGDDGVIRARNSVDVTAAKKDVRFGAGKGFYCGSGLAEETVGGMLFEARSYGTEQEYPEKGGEKVKSSGITFKTKDSAFNVLSREIYLRTCGPVLQDGNIVLDCNDGRGDIVTASNNFTRFLRGAARDVFGFEKVQKVNEFTRERALFCASIWAEGSIRTNGGILAQRSVVSLNGNFLNNVGGQVRRYLDRALYDGQLREIGSTQQQQVYDSTDYYDRRVKQPFKVEKKIGHEDMIKKVSFGMRTEKDCGTESFVLPQTCWQLYADNGAGGMEAWTEKPVKYQETEETVAWPAKEAWNERATLLTLPAANFGFFNLSEGLAKPTKGGAYENPTTGPYVRKVPKSDYMVLSKEE